MPLLKAKNFYEGDLVFSQGDVSDEIVFVLRGHVTLFVDISDLVELPEGTIDHQSQAFNVPFSVYNKGSYFGDEDVLLESAFEDLQDANEKSQKKKDAGFLRSCTAQASEDLEVMILKKRHIIEQLTRFKRIKNYMVLIAKAKTDYH